MKKPTADISSKVEKAIFELADFPTLHVNVLGEKITVVGTLPINDEDIEIDSYALEIQLDDRHPEVPPLVFEIAGRIPRILDRHVYPDTGALCLGVREEIWPAPGCQIHLDEFLNGPVRNYLLGNTVVESGLPWPQGARSHGGIGILEYYAEMFEVSDASQVATLLSYAVRPAKGHWPCFCASGKKMRDCHRDSVSKLRQNIRPEVMWGTFQLITDANSTAAANSKH